PHEQPFHAVDHARPGIRSARLAQHLGQSGYLAEIAADHIEVEWRSHDDGAVAAVDRDDVVRAETQPAEQVVEIAEPYRYGDHAEKLAVGVGDAAAQHDGIGAPMQHRMAEE